jgi:hypothetical protein
MRDDADQLAVAIGGLLPLAVAPLLVPLREHMITANIALILMATVVLAASFGGRPAGAIAAVVATLSFDFWFTRPYLSLTMDSADDIETALVLLVTGVFVGTLTGRRLRLVRRAAHSREEVARLHRVADLIAHDAQPAEILFACERELTELLGLSACVFTHDVPPTGLPRIERDGALSGARTRRFVNGEFALPPEGVDLPVVHRGQRVGSFVLSPRSDVGVSLEQRVVAIAIADQAGAALGPSPANDGEGSNR